MSTRPHIAAKITVVGSKAVTLTTVAVLDDKLSADGAIVNSPNTYIYFYSSSGVPNTVGPLYLNDEGVTWLQGHHLDDSKEVAAARVAQALSKPVVESSVRRAPPLVNSFGGTILGELIGHALTIKISEKKQS